MNDKVMVQLLDEQAEELRRGEDPTPEMRATFRHEPQMVGDLLELARRLKDALPQLEPGRAYVADLRAKLVERFPKPPSPEEIRARLRERRLMWAAAGLGVLGYLVGIAAIGARFMIYMVGLVGVVAGVRRRAGPGSRRRKLAG